MKKAKFANEDPEDRIRLGKARTACVGVRRSEAQTFHGPDGGDLHLALDRIPEEEIVSAISAIKDLRARTGHITRGEILTARHEGHKY